MLARKQQNGKQLTCLFLSRCHFLLSLYPSLLVCRPPLPTEQSPSSRAFHHLLESDTESPPSLQEDSSHDACRGAPAPTWRPPCRLRGALLWARLSASVHAPLGNWAVTQACVVPAPFLSKREAAWGPRECPPHIRGQGLLIFVMNLPQQIPRDVLSHQRLILALLWHFYFTLRGISVLSNLWNVIFFFCKFSNLLQSSPTFFFFQPQ